MNHLPSPVPYREDINGLRAWAVIAVLLFHFQLPGLGAGFMGVDIFFVISGFLMTAIIVKGLERNNFSIWKFYMARARRILPALMVVIAVLLACNYSPHTSYSS
jgi:peptidoglycan/LPS O-acetylase OafA/YrhL